MTGPRKDCQGVKYLLNPSQVCMLRYLNEHHGITRGELTKVSWGTRVQMSEYNRVKRLEDRGFIKDRSDVKNKAELYIATDGIVALRLYDIKMRERMRKEAEGKQ